MTFQISGCLFKYDYEYIKGKVHLHFFGHFFECCHCFLTKIKLSADNCADFDMIYLGGGRRGRVGCSEGERHMKDIILL